MYTGRVYVLMLRGLATLGLWLWQSIATASDIEPTLSPQAAKPHGVIVLYHRVSDSGPDSTRISPAQFSAHLDQLAAGGYTVIPLDSLLNGIYNHAPLPEKPIAITFDDAYRSVGEVAYPMLRQRQLPFSVFIASGVIDNEGSSFLSWSALHELALDPLVSFGGHSVHHPHMELLPIASSAPHEASRIDEIDTNMARLRARLGDSVIDAFAYPYGEYSLETETLLQERGLFGLAQQSGAVDAGVARTRIPRFPLYQGRDDQLRLQRALTTRALPILEETPDAIVIPVDAEAPSHWRFKWGKGPFNAHQLACYAATGAALSTELNDGWATVTLPTFKVGRNKINCTAPSTDQPGSYFWYARLWLKLSSDGLPD